MASADVEAVDFEPEDDDLMDEDGAVDVDNSSPRAPLPKLKSAITGGAPSSLAAAPKKTKGRGFRDDTDADRNSRFAARDFDSLDSDGGPGPQRCQCSLSFFLIFLLCILGFAHLGFCMPVVLGFWCDSFFVSSFWIIYCCFSLGWVRTRLN